MEASEVKQITRSLHRYAYGFWQAHLLAQIRERVMLVAETVKQDEHVRCCVVFWGCVVECQCECFIRKNMEASDGVSSAEMCMREEGS